MYVNRFKFNPFSWHFPVASSFSFFLYICYYALASCFSSLHTHTHTHVHSYLTLLTVPLCAKTQQLLITLKWQLEHETVTHTARHTTPNTTSIIVQFRSGRFHFVPMPIRKSRAKSSDIKFIDTHTVSPISVCVCVLY